MFRLLSILSVSFLIAACAARPASAPLEPLPSVGAPQAKIGDFWEYAVRDGYTGIARGTYRYEVTGADPNRLIVTLTHEGRLLDTLVYGTGWNGVELPLTNLQRFRYEPIYVAYAYPLEPGKRWKNLVRSTDVATGKSYRTHIQGKVVGWERITVPAGEFDALKVQREVFAGNMEGFRTQEEIIETDWYVPGVRRAVRTHTNSQHFDSSRGGGDGGGEYPLRIRGDWLIAELIGYSR